MTRIAELQDRLRRLAKRREGEGIYTDANLVEAASSRIAELEAKVERLTKERDDALMVKREAVAGWRDAESLSRTGAVKVKALIEDALRELDNATALTDQDSDCLGCAENLLNQALTTEPAAPEGRQEAVTQFRRTGCSDWYDGLPDHTDGGGPYETRVLYTRPSEQAVTDEMVEAVQRIRKTAMRQSAVARIPECGEFGGIAQDADWLLDALKAAMEAGRHE